MLNWRFAAAFAIVIAAVAAASPARAAGGCAAQSVIGGTCGALTSVGAEVRADRSTTGSAATHVPQITAYLNGAPLYDGDRGLTGHCITQGATRNPAAASADAVCVSFPAADAGTPAVSMADVAGFPPHPTGLTVEPANWMLRDAPTNFVVDAGEHVVSSTLLGRAAEVRYTPVGYGFDYGDGATATSGTGGDTWADLGLHEFSETATSHVYSVRGRYTVTATADYTAEYRLDGADWIPIDGILPVSTSVERPAVTIDPVLVRGPCERYPGDPGCPLWNPDAAQPWIR